MKFFLRAMMLLASVSGGLLLGQQAPSVPLVPQTCEDMGLSNPFVLYQDTADYLSYSQSQINFHVQQLNMLNPDWCAAVGNVADILAQEVGDKDDQTLSLSEINFKVGQLAQQEVQISRAVIAEAGATNAVLLKNLTASQQTKIAGLGDAVSTADTLIALGGDVG